MSHNKIKIKQGHFFLYQLTTSHIKLFNFSRCYIVTKDVAILPLWKLTSSENHSISPGEKRQTSARAMNVGCTADRQCDYSRSNSPPSGGKSKHHCLIEH